MLVGMLYGEQFGDVAVKNMCTVAQMYLFFLTAYVQVNYEKRIFAAEYCVAAGSVNFANR
jgi:hypothetical protein